ncbi:hypothetical protein HII36_09715 [Nonomuraea sp. NN258]|uniref:hypothetical protein n=1 Tax=Nonomuraea antri TaxID=2730852 RepID=UPI0015690BF5|nr:hypothetical protein [Nonomuraea antri]NRQ32113.1 hypothetical protein [Nonomuraea antri]
MEIRWRDLVICDYEVALADGVSGRGAVVEYDLYGRGLHIAPRVLLDDPAPLGRIRRPGIVDVPATEYDAFCAAVQHRLLDLPGALAVRSAFETARSKFWSRISKLESRLNRRGAAAQLAMLTVALDDLMALHTLNWLLPREAAEAHLTQVFADEHAARTCLLALMVPSEPAHVVDVYAWLLRTASTGDTSAFADQKGFLQAQGLTASPWEDPAVVARTIEQFSNAETQQALTKLRHLHERASQRRSDFYAAALLASSSDGAAYQRTQALAVICRLAADEEEFRKVAQQQTLRTLRKLAEQHGRDPYELTLADFLELAQEMPA